MLYINKQMRDVSGVIENDEELRQMASWLGNGYKTQDVDKTDRIYGFDKLLPDGRTLHLAFGIGTWVWIQLTAEQLAASKLPQVGTASTQTLDEGEDVGGADS